MLLYTDLSTKPGLAKAITNISTAQKTPKNKHNPVLLSLCSFFFLSTVMYKEHIHTDLRTQRRAVCNTWDHWPMTWKTYALFEQSYD